MSTPPHPVLDVGAQVEVAEADSEAASELLPPQPGYHNRHSNPIHDAYRHAEKQRASSIAIAVVNRLKAIVNVVCDACASRVSGEPGLGRSEVEVADKVQVLGARP